MKKQKQESKNGRVKERKRDERGDKDRQTQKDKGGGGERRGNIPRSAQLIFRQTDNRRVSLPTLLTELIQIHWLLPTSICSADQAFLNISSWENSKRILLALGSTMT